MLQVSQLLQVLQLLQDDRMEWCGLGDKGGERYDGGSDRRRNGILERFLVRLLIGWWRLFSLWLGSRLGRVGSWLALSASAVDIMKIMIDKNNRVSMMAERNFHGFPV